MPTLEEIIQYAPVSNGDGYDITTVMGYVTEKDVNGSYWPTNHEYTGVHITMDIVVDVQYDHRRGAQTSVLRFDGEPFSIVSRSGRELSDDIKVYIVSPEHAEKALKDWAASPDFGEFVYNKEAIIELAYWEGTRVSLGDSGRKEIDT